MFENSISVSASVKDSKTLITIGNFSCTDDVQIILEGVGEKIPEYAKAQLLFHEDMHAHNTFENPDKVVPTEQDIDTTKEITIPKAGILAIRF